VQSWGLLMESESERQLVEAAISGDIESFGELCSRYYTAMVAVAYAVLSDHQLAEDAAQESFARALVNLKNLKNRSRFAPWLAAICRNIAKDMVAAKARQTATAALSQLAHEDNNDEDYLAVRLAIEQLPAPSKELIFLRYYNSLSYEQIGSVLGISRATINGRILRTKRKMARYLRKNGFPENRL
jgi:RNA polymerase sigma factor (sigma-70 family)